MNDPKTRAYSSPLRESQALQTRDLILDSLTELLAERRVDEVSTREIARHAGVSQPTVYRHFPDREALIEGLTRRLPEQSGRLKSAETLNEFVDLIMEFFAKSEEFPIETTAEALLNADPRRFSADTRAHTEDFLRIFESDLPNVDEHTRMQLAGLLRCIGSTQTWLRMREEFGVLGTESGPIVAWAINTLVREVRNGNIPESPTAPKN